MDDRTAVVARPASLSEGAFTYCPGCGHGLVERLIAEIIDEAAVRELTVGLIGAGCSTASALKLFNFDRLGCLHGRAPAVATGLKRVLPDSFVFTLQGDGDATSIGIAELIHAAVRGEKITVFMLNNSNYGNTGGQMAPTTLLGQVTATTPTGRDESDAGAPLRMAEILAQIEGAAYVARTAVNSPAAVARTKKALRRALDVQMARDGFSYVEIISQCPTHWRLDPVDALAWVDERVTPAFPLAEFKTPQTQPR